MNTKHIFNMKHSKLILVFLLFAVTFTACKKDNEIEPNAPEITGLEIGTDNKKIAHPGNDLHVEAQIVAQSNIASVTLEIHPETGTGWTFSTTYTEGFAGAKNAEFHKHIDVPADAPVGAYHVHLKVKDEAGRETSVESDLKLEADPTLPSVTGFEVGLNAAGNDLHSEATITAPNKIAKITVEIHGAAWEKEFIYTDANMVGLTTYNFHKHMNVADAPKGHYHVHLKIVDQANKENEFEEHFDKP